MCHGCFSAATRLVCKQNETNTAPMTHGLGVLVLHVHQSTRLATTRSVAGRPPTGFLVALCWFSLPFHSLWLQSVVIFSAASHRTRAWFCPRVIVTLTESHKKTKDRMLGDRQSRAAVCAVGTRLSSLPCLSWLIANSSGSLFGGLAKV